MPGGSKLVARNVAARYAHAPRHFTAIKRRDQLLLYSASGFAVHSYSYNKSINSALKVTLSFTKVQLALSKFAQSGRIGPLLNQEEVIYYTDILTRV